MRGRRGGCGRFDRGTRLRFSFVVDGERTELAEAHDDGGLASDGELQGCGGLGPSIQGAARVERAGRAGRLDVDRELEDARAVNRNFRDGS